MEHLLASKVDIRLHLVRLALQVPINLHFPEKLPYVIENNSRSYTSAGRGEGGH